MKNDNAPNWEDFKYHRGLANSFVNIGGHFLWVETLSGGRLWRMDSGELGRRKLQSKTLPEAKREALELVAQRFESLAQQARKAIEEIDT